jgi:hypothetical protein
MGSGGVRGKVAGIAHRIMIVAGFITIVFQDFILTWTHIGEDTIRTIIGTVTFGIINRFLIHNFNETGRAGRVTDIGNRKEPGVFRVIHLSHNDRVRY